MQEQDRIIKINIEEEMKKSYIDPPGCERRIQARPSPYLVRDDGTGKYIRQTL